ncbi:MAG: LPS assembly protein LptD [Desulfobacteraceae bacterium]|jgi:LPS-assembly protein|nr:LPS assembly protein LptD [Desulfobacteraceae bacterium]
MEPKNTNPAFRRTAPGPNRFDHRHSYFPATLPLIATCILLTAFLLIVAVPTAAQMNTQKNESIIRDPKLPWQLEADRVDYDQAADEYTATGNVLIYKKNIRLSADFVRFDRKNMMAYAEGNVVLTDGEDILNGVKMEIDLEGQTGSIEDGYLFLKENNYHITGDVIKKVGPKTYTIDDATVTTCDGDKPDWKITGKKVKIKEDGEGTATHAAIWAKKMPVLYTPYFYYPARKKRQTGLLLPAAGTSDRWGAYYSQPFFWAIDKSSDATFYGQYMRDRGFRPGAEYRYYLDEWSKGTWMVDGLFDRRVDDGTGNSSVDWGFDDGNRTILRKNKERYWLRGSHQQKMPWDIRGRLDVDLVSDQDYTREFQNGPLSWKDSKDYFEKEFGLDLDDFNDPVRTNLLNFNKLWPSYSFNAKLLYNLDSTVRNSGMPDEILQQLPIIEFNGVKQRIGTSSFFYNLNSQYVYYWSKDADRGQRADLWPRLFLPLQVKPFFTIEPSIGVRETLWYLDKNEFGPEDKKFYNRELFDTALTLSSDIFNVFHLEGETVKAIKHTIRPQVTHAYIPNVDQSDLPSFDSIDRIDQVNLVTYSLTNTLTSKTKKEGSFESSRRVGQTQAGIIGSPANYAYNDFLRFKLEQTYDINEARENDPDKPFSPIYAELDLFPGRYLALDADARWSVYDLSILSHNVAANIWDLRGDKLSIEYRYTKNSDEIGSNETNSLNGALTVKVTDRLRVNGSYEYNFLDDVQIGTGLGFFYESQCWSFDGQARQTTGVDNDKKYAFEFKISLSGLGELEF